jgi:putative restriction endonuclease
MGDEERQASEFLDRLRRLRQHSYAGRRALHKPLLILYALGRLKHHGVRRVRYREAKSQVEPLLHRYGPPGTRARVADPFARLEGDGIWTLISDERATLFDAGGNARPGALDRQDPEAGFDGPTLNLLGRRPALIDEAARVLLDANFPPDIHEEVLGSVGLRLEAR